MYWADQIATKLDDTNHHKVDDMKTPSGHAHAGSLRAISTHGLIYEAMKKAGHDVEFSYVVNDLDPMDGLPVYLSKEEYGEHMGKPLYNIPAPDGKSNNFAEQYANEYIAAFNKLGFYPKLTWSHDLYFDGKMNKYIKLALDNVETIRKIYKDIAGQDKPEGWYPFQIICPNCGKIGTNLVTDWDGEEVTYECMTDMVTWAKGCGHKGKSSPFDGKGKLAWKVDWPAYWSVLGITVEGAGKDHFSAGGSRYIGAKIIKDVFNIEAPFGFLHEFLLIGGAKMSSSKGNATSAKDLVSFLPQDVTRFLFVRAPYQRAINFDPYMSETIPDLFDEFDRCAKTYYKVGIEKDFGRYYEASQLDKSRLEKSYLPRFRQIATFLQMPSINLQKYFEEEKGSKFTKVEKTILEERIKFAKIWLEKFAGPEDKYEIFKKVPNQKVSEAQIEFIEALGSMLQKGKYDSGEKLQHDVFELTKKLEVSSKDGFQSIYKILMDKIHGPKAGWVIFDLLQSDRDFIVNHFLNIRKTLADLNLHNDNKAAKFKYPEVTNVIIDTDLKAKWPSIVIGYAEIHNVGITKLNDELEKLKQEFIDSQAELTRETINKFVEVQSYRKMYKEFGVDWHSRRPSPEALLRRVADGRDLYNINTCVDAYNLVVMKNRVSVGAFDMDKLNGKVTIKQAKGGEEITLLMDDKPTILKQNEVSYFDEAGPYNMDYNYRDADRTKVTTDTKNLVINIDGVYDADRAKVEQSLSEVIKIITKFCGGEVKNAGIIV